MVEVFLREARFAQIRDSQGKAIVDLLDEFANLRASNLRDLRRLRQQDYGRVNRSSEE
jgi:hypothetical protein